MATDDIGPPLINTSQGETQTDARAREDARTPEKARAREDARTPESAREREDVRTPGSRTKRDISPKGSSRPFNRGLFAVSLERAARKAGNGIGLVLQGRELPVMKTINRDSQQLKHSLRVAGAPHALENTPYLETHPGIRHAITHGELARQEDRHMLKLEKRTQERRRKAQQLLLEQRPTGALHLPHTPRPPRFDLSDRQVTFHEYVDIRKKFVEHRAALSDVTRSRQKGSALHLWRNNLSAAHCRTPSPLLRDSYRASFLSYSLAPRYLPAKGEMEQYM